jgi:16S rRNA (guanine527-N7)-methyltransferase
VNAAFERVVRERSERAGVPLTSEQLAQFLQYYQLLARWNRTINLTALPLNDYPAPTIDRLLLEPALAAHYFTAATRDWIDVGSGGGSPALPLKILRPAASLKMVESRERKAAFLREVVRTLGLERCEVVAARVEQWADSQPAAPADLITIRAVKPDASILLAAAHLLRPGGRLLVFASTASLDPENTVFHDAGFGFTESAPLLTAENRLVVLTRRAVPRGTSES